MTKASTVKIKWSLVSTFLVVSCVDRDAAPCGGAIAPHARETLPERHTHLRASLVPLMSP
jgi:hypothetical protein